MQTAPVLKLLSSPRGTATAARVHAARLRLAQNLTIPAPEQTASGLWRALGWTLVLVGNLTIALLCVPGVWVVPSAVLLTTGLWMIGNSLALAHRLGLASLWWRALLRLQRHCNGDNLCRLLFVAGLLLAMWNLSGPDQR